MGQLTEILHRLQNARVEFSLIGGLASVHYGVTLVTQDVDICARFTLENLRQIETALKDLNPKHRFTTNLLPFELTDELCRSLKNIYLTTDLGVLDCLSEVIGVGNFDQVLRQSQLMKFPFGPCHVLKLDALIKSKLALGRDRDLAAVQQLRAIKEKIDAD